jgi:hypothetical protein
MYLVTLQVAYRQLSASNEPKEARSNFRTYLESKEFCLVARSNVELAEVLESVLPGHCLRVFPGGKVRFGSLYRLSGNALEYKLKIESLHGDHDAIMASLCADEDTLSKLAEGNRILRNSRNSSRSFIGSFERECKYNPRANAYCRNGTGVIRRKVTVSLAIDAKESEPVVQSRSCSMTYVTSRDVAKSGLVSVKELDLD